MSGGSRRSDRTALRRSLSISCQIQCNDMIAMAVLQSADKTRLYPMRIDPANTSPAR
jgi:hypothetical protein